MVVKIMVPFWVPIINTGPNTGPSLGDPKRDHDLDNPPKSSELRDHKMV